MASRERILAKVLTEYVLGAHFTGGCSELETFFPPGKGHGARERLEGLVSLSAYRADTSIIQSIERDLEAVKERDPACDDFLSPFLYFKGFQALSGLPGGTLAMGAGQARLSSLSAEFDLRGLRRGYSSCCGYWQRYSS